MNLSSTLHLNKFGTLAIIIALQISIPMHSQTMSTEKEIIALAEADSLSKIAEEQAKVGNLHMAIDKERQALKIRETILGIDNIDYYVSLCMLSVYELYALDFKAAIDNENKKLNFEEKNLSFDPSYKAKSLRTLAFLQNIVGNHSEAIEYGLKSLNIMENLYGEEHKEYIESLDRLGSCYYSMGEYNETRKLAIKSLKIKKKILGEETVEYTTSLDLLAYCYYAIGDYKTAIETEEKSRIIKEKIIGTENISYAYSLCGLMIFHICLENKEEALKYGLETKEVYRRIKENSDSHIEDADYAQFLGAFSSCYYINGKYEEAIQMGLEALKIKKKIFGSNHINNAPVLCSIGSCYYAMGEYKKAIEYENEVLNIYKKNAYKEHPNYIVSLHNLAGYYGKVDEESKAAAYIIEAKDLVVKWTQKNFVDMVAHERDKFWKKYQKLFANDLPEIAYTCPNDSLIINAYDGILFNKGLLLNSEIEMTKLLLESNDQENINNYKSLQQLRQKLTKLYEKPIAEQQENIDSIERVATRLERRLMQRSKIYGDYTRNLLITWKDVQKKMNKKDIAVEFVSFTLGKDSTIYIAYVLDTKMLAPKMVTLFEGRQLTNIARENYYTTPQLTSLVWSPLKEYMKKAKNVYFAPSGELYNIAIEYLPDTDNAEKRVSDRWNFYRLSSTRELAVTKNSEKFNDAALYGGLLYDTDTAFLEADSKKHNTIEQPDFVESNELYALHLRGGMEYLPATQTEAENINKSLKKASINSRLYTGNDGTEASFKDLSAKKMSILHIATHGFFWSEEEAQMKDYLNFLMLDGNINSRYVEDRSMTRTGLLFSGANNVLKGKKLPENVENGILTAQEISQLDFRGLDLVVLSACQTGLGEITGEGVFGLQRGFKKAGANTILMSLWKVPDTPTQLLMTRFYDNLLINKNPNTGKPFTKVEALKNAQQYVRDYETMDENSDSNIKPYSSPECWASFILLDAIN